MLKKMKKKSSVERQQVSPGIPANVPSVGSQQQNTMASLGGSPTFPKTGRQRLFQKVTGENSKLKLELQTLILEQNPPYSACRDANEDEDTGGSHRSSWPQTHAIYLHVYFLTQACRTRIRFSLLHVRSLNTKEGNNKNQGPGSRSTVVFLTKDTRTC